MEWPAWSALLHTLKTGNTGSEHAFEMGLFDYLARHAEFGSRFDRLMGQASVGVSAAVIEAYDFSSVKTFVDIAGGNGTLAAAILRANAHLRFALALLWLSHPPPFISRL